MAYVVGDITLCELVEVCECGQEDSCEDKFYGMGCGSCRYNKEEWQPVNDK